MKIFQLEDGFKYNTDTMLMYDFASKLPLKGAVLEVGAGNGAIGLMLKRDFKDINLTLVDILEINSKLARKNAEYNGIECDIVCADFASYKSERRFDFIISNPPFYPDCVTKSDNKFLQISRYSKNLPLNAFVKTANSLLTPRGVFAFCYEARRVDEVIVALCEFRLKLVKLKFAHTRAHKSAYMVFVVAQKSSKSACEVEKPYLVCDENGYTAQMKEITSRANLVSDIFKLEIR